MNTEPHILKPEPIEVREKIKVHTHDADSALAIATLAQGESILVTDYYNDGIALLKEVHKYLQLQLPNTSFQEQQEYRAAYHQLSNRILLEVVDQQLSVKKAPSIGWLKRFYPDRDLFLLTLPQIQGMNSSWQWYQKGVSIPVLRNKIHPYYGTYFPTRYEHLILFDNWLKRYKGMKKSAIEVGIGSGVMALQLIQHSFQKVFATDINPNAIVGMREFMGTTKLSRKIELDLGNLFGAWNKQTELIVFNPPWLPATINHSGIDDAMYYSKDLFPDFFAAAKKRLLPDGKLVLIFSNLAQITKQSSVHPIELELAQGNRFQLERCFTKSVKAASNKTKRNQHWRDAEVVELWELKHV